MLLNHETVIAVLVVLAVTVAFVKGYLWIRDGGAYYARYPGAKLLDDAAKQGKLPAGGTEAIIARLGAANDLAAEAQKLRDELSIK